MADSFRYDLIPPGSRVLCALSGGADSMYLLCRLAAGAERGGYTLQAAHYNHRLRESAARDEDFVRGWCEARAIPLSVGGGDVAAEAARLGLGVEETARRLRYAFLEETAGRTGCTLIATGHQAGDQAETVLMNLIRGSGGRGLRGIPERRGNIIRPMLAVTRQEIEGYLAARHIPHVEDESNGDLSYTRNRVRHGLLPLLRELNPRAEEHIIAAARRLREDEAFLSRLGEELVARAVEEDGELVLPVAELTAAPGPVALRVLALLAERVGGRVSACHLEALLALCRGGGESRSLDLPGCTARRSQGKLWLIPAGEREELPPLSVTEGEYRWGEWTVSVRPARCPERAFVSAGEFYLKPGDCLIRPRRTGDALSLGNRPRKSVKKLMMEGGIPAHLRGRLPVVAQGDGVAALGGFGPDRERLAGPGQPALHMILTKENER